MKDKIFMILLGIIAVNLTIQTVKDVEIFPTAHAQSQLAIERAVKDALMDCLHESMIEEFGANTYIYLKSSCTRSLTNPISFCSVP